MQDPGPVQGLIHDATKTTVDGLFSRLVSVRRRILHASAAAARPDGAVRLLAVSKLQPSQAVRSAFEAGQQAFGENYVQEALDKIGDLADLRAHLEWHLIGPLQSNKTRQAAEAFDWVQSVDRLKIAQRLNEQRPPALPPLNVCLQVNVSGEASKSGLAPQEVPKVAHAVAALPRLRLRGLMAIPEPAAGLPRSASRTGRCANCSRRCAPRAWPLTLCRWA